MDKKELQAYVCSGLETILGSGDLKHGKEKENGTESDQAAESR